MPRDSPKTSQGRRNVQCLLGSILTLKENGEALVAAAREIGLEVSVDETKHMVMS